MKPRLPELMSFDGSDYDPDLDQKRLTGQIKRIFDCMIDGKWRTLSEIKTETGDPEASVSAQLRHLRKARLGHHMIEKRRRGKETAGYWEYKLIPNMPGRQQKLF